MLLVNLTMNSVLQQENKTQYQICTLYKAYKYVKDRKVKHDSWTDNYASNTRR
jgi:hypothetical protein